MPRTRTPAPPARGYDVAAMNALRHGVLSRYTVLPWEDAGGVPPPARGAGEKEHAPTGPTEEHLVEELAGVVWRKRRLRLAEAFANRRALETATTPAAGFVSVMPTPDPAAAGVPEGLHATGEGGRTPSSPASRRTRGCDAASARPARRRGAGRPTARRSPSWTRTRRALGGRGCRATTEGDPPAANTEALRRFLEDEVLPWYARRQRELAKRALVVEKGFGWAAEAAGLERLGRYEVHLDRKLERTLAMLLRLKQLRGGPDTG